MGVQHAGCNLAQRFPLGRSLLPPDKDHEFEITDDGHGHDL